MAWFKALRNARVGKMRYLKDSVSEIDPALLAGKMDNFVACDAPGKAAAPKAEAPAKAKKTEVKLADLKAPEVKAPEVKAMEAPKAKTDPVI